jgi:hypothetical protein
LQADIGLRVWCGSRVEDLDKFGARHDRDERLLLGIPVQMRWRYGRVRRDPSNRSIELSDESVLVPQETYGEQDG